MGIQLPSPEGHSPQFWPYICRGQMPGWIKMPLGSEVGLGRSDIVSDGDFSPKRGTVPNFRSMSIVAKRLDGSRCHLVRDRHRHRPHCVRWGPAPPPPKKKKEWAHPQPKTKQNTFWHPEAVPLRRCPPFFLVRVRTVAPHLYSRFHSDRFRFGKL